MARSASTVSLEVLEEEILLIIVSLVKTCSFPIVWPSRGGLDSFSKEAGKFVVIEDELAVDSLSLVYLLTILSPVVESSTNLDESLSDAARDKE